MPTVTYKNTEYVIPEIPLAPSYVVARAGPIFVARNGRTGQYQFVDEDPYRVLIQCKEELKKTEGGMILLKAGEYVLSKTFPDEDIRDKVLVTGEGRATVVKAPSGVSPFNPNWVRLDNLVWYDEAGKEHDETLVVVTEVSDGAITTPKIANLAVTTEKIADGAVVNTKIADGTIDLSRKALDGSLTNAKIADGTIDLTKKCTYVPVNKAGDIMQGDLVISKTNPTFNLVQDGVTRLVVGYKKNYGIGIFGFNSRGGWVFDLRTDLPYLHISGLLYLNASMGPPIIVYGSVAPFPDAALDLGHSYSRWKNIYTNLLNLKSYTSDPSLEAGLLWFRSDLGRLRFSPDGSAIKEFVHRDGDAMTGSLTISGDIMPSAWGAYNLGSTSYRWKEIRARFVEASDWVNGGGAVLGNGSLSLARLTRDPPIGAPTLWYRDDLNRLIFLSTKDWIRHELMYRDGDTMTGNLDMGGNKILNTKDAVIHGQSYREWALINNVIVR